MFIILGIIIVAVGVTVFSLKDYIFKSEFERDADKFKVVEDFEIIYDVYQSCVSDLAKDGIGLMALQGGYIDIPNYEYVVNPLIPFSNKLDVFDNGALEVAYWFYETGNGIQTKRIPALDEMELSLENYIDENLYFCAFYFEDFPEYELNNFENFDVDVEINDYMVFIELKSNFDVDYKGLNQKFDDVKIALDSSLGYLYSKAVEVYNKQMQEDYVEYKTLDFLIIYDDIPYSGESFSCNPRVWNKQTVEKDFKEILEINIDAISNVNDKYYEFDLGDGSLDVGFSYNKKWPFYMDINGGEDMLTEESVFGENSQAADFLMALFCLNNYHFIYDIKYPVLTRLSKDGLDFQFAFEVIVDNNQPKENLLGMETLPEVDNQICDSKNTWINLNVIDYESDELLDDARIKFSCVGTSCDVGETSFDEFGSYSFSGYMPSCVNADIKTYKEGYHFGSLTLDTNEEASNYVYMKKLHNMNIDLKIVDGGNAREVYDDEIVFVNFINEEDGFSQFLNGNNVDLIVGDYIIRSYIMKESRDPIKIEGDTVESCVDVPKSGVLGALGVKEKKCFTSELEDIELDQVLIGGNEFEWSYDGGSNVVIYVTYDKMPNTVNEMGDIYTRIFDKERVRYPEVI